MVIVMMLIFSKDRLIGMCVVIMVDSHVDIETMWLGDVIE